MFKNRTFVTADALNAKVAEIVANTDACVYCVVGPVEAFYDNFGGCNWTLPQVLGKHCSECQDGIHAALAELREQFNLVSQLQRPVTPAYVRPTERLIDTVD